MPRCRCPFCSAIHNVPVEQIGRRGRCVSCQSVFDLNAEPVSPSPVSNPVQVPPVSWSPIAFTVSTPSEPPEESESQTTWRRPGEVEPLTHRPALASIAFVLLSVSILILIAALIVLGYAIRVGITLGFEHTIVFSLVGISLLGLAIFLMALSELILLLIGVESRLHEISRNVSR